MSTATFRSLVPPLVPVKQLEPMQMPVIDLSKLYQTNKTRSLVIREIATACRDIGCFQVRYTLTNPRCTTTWIDFTALFGII